MNQRLTRDMDNAMLGGVCAGIAKRYNFDVTVVRLLWLLLAVLSVGVGVVLYVVTWIIMPRPDQVPPQPPESQGAQSGGASGLESDLMSLGDRVAESARVVARATRTTAEEIADIARGTPSGERERPGGGTAQQPSRPADASGPTPPGGDTPETRSAGSSPASGSAPAPGSPEPTEGVVPPTSDDDSEDDRRQGSGSGPST